MTHEEVATGDVAGNEEREEDDHKEEDSKAVLLGVHPHGGGGIQAAGRRAGCGRGLPERAPRHAPELLPPLLVLVQQRDEAAVVLH
jgi:hypothetical protein